MATYFCQWINESMIIFTNLSLVSALSLSGLRWIRSLSWQQSIPGCEALWMGNPPISCCWEDGGNQRIHTKPTQIWEETPETVTWAQNRTGGPWSCEAARWPTTHPYHLNDNLATRNFFCQSGYQCHMMWAYDANYSLTLLSTRDERPRTAFLLHKQLWMSILPHPWLPPQ